MKSAACESWADAIERAAAAAPPEAPTPPPSDPEQNTDPLAILARVQAGLERDLSRLPPPQVVQRRAIASVLVQVAKGAESIRRGRPIEETADEVTRRIVEVHDAAIERTSLLTSERAAKFRADLAAFEVWCTTLGPFGAEVRARVDAMLGRAT